jgi:aminodeoxyfutalosine deaminase
MTTTIHRAKYALVNPDLLIENAAVQISSGHISSTETWENPSPGSDVEVVDWGSAVIMPGLVNAHTHLELTSAHNRLRQFSSFTDWIAKLIAIRRNWTAGQIFDSISEGARLSLASGVTLVGDITSSDVSTSPENYKLRRIFFEEVISLAPERADECLSKLSFEPANPGSSPSVHCLSPHAPYSVSAQLYQGTAELARKQRRLLATHVAETKAELQFLRDGTGEFREFLNSMNLLPADWKPPGVHPIAYLDSLGVLGNSCSLIHCNYLDEQSIARISKSKSSVVYCPRSHHFFGHENHPVRSLLDSGINVALGTDSLASNDSLSVLDEMRFLFKTRKDIRAEEIFRAATLNGAAALGFSGVLGRLDRGYWADMTILALPHDFKPRNALGQILEGAGDCIATIVHGQIEWRKS